MIEAELVIFVMLGGVVFMILLSILIYNRIVTKYERTNEAWSGIRVQLKRRADLVPNLVETVKGYASHEQDVLNDVTKARSALQQSNGVADTANANQAFMKSLGQLFVVVENYPELKASTNFADLQDELADIEEKIAYARQFYNRNSADFNAFIQSIPNVFIARMGGFNRFDFFEDDNIREDIHISFSKS